LCAVTFSLPISLIFLGYESYALLCSNCFYLGPINVFVDIFANIGDAWLVIGKKTPYVSFFDLEQYDIYLLLM